MKKLLPILLVIFAVVATASSCNNKVKSIDHTEHESHEEVNVETNSDMIPHSSEEDCHGVRKTIHSIKDKEGEIMMIGGNILISIPPGTKRYKICDVAEEIKVEGLKVRFSGVVLEIFPNERLMGTPMRLSSIDIIK